MELVLNVAWFIVAAASYALLFRRLASGSAERARELSRCQCVIALSSVLAILFPVISLTDDLHEMQATVEEASPSVLVAKKCVVNHSSKQGPTLHQVSFVFASFATGARWAVLGVVAAQQTARSSPGLHLASLGRSPPSLAASQIS